MLINVFVLDLTFNLEFYLFMGLFHFVFHSFLMIQLLFSFQQVQGIFFADLSIVSKQLYMFDLQVNITVLNFVKFSSAQFKIL